MIWILSIITMSILGASDSNISFSTKESYEIPLNNLVEEPNLMQQLHPVTLKPLAANESSTPKTVPGRAKTVNSDESTTDPQVYRIYSYAADSDIIPVGPRKTEKQSSDERILEQ